MKYKSISGYSVRIDGRWATLNAETGAISTTSSSYGATMWTNHNAAMLFADELRRAFNAKPQVIPNVMHLTNIIVGD